MTTSAADATFQAIRAAVESRDADALVGLIAEDATMLNYGKRNPPSQPEALEGKAAIETWLRDIYGRDMAHEVRDEVVGDERISFNEWCEYPDGSRVLASNVFELREGQIVRAVMNQTWDD